MLKKKKKKKKKKRQDKILGQDPIYIQLTMDPIHA